MKKHAILIQCHTEIPYWLEYAKKHHYVNLYVHLDAKSEFLFNVGQLDNVFFCQPRVNVAWGGVSQVEASILLMELALENEDNAFFHLVSGEDVVLKNFAEIEEEWDKSHNFSIMMECFASKKHGYRVRFNHPFANTNNIQSFTGKVITKLLMLLDIILNYRLRAFIGSSWFSIARSDLELLLTTVHDKKYLTYFKNKLCPDEHLFQIAAMGSNILNSYLSSVGNKRYIVFNSRYNRGRNPVYLNCEQLNEAKDNYWFARKVRPEVALSFLDRQ